MPCRSHLPLVVDRSVGFVGGQYHLQLGILCKATCPVEEDL